MKLTNSSIRIAVEDRHKDALMKFCFPTFRMIFEVIFKFAGVEGWMGVIDSRPVIRFTEHYDFEQSQAIAKEISGILKKIGIKSTIESDRFSEDETDVILYLSNISGEICERIFQKIENPPENEYEDQ